MVINGTLQVTDTAIASAGGNAPDTLSAPGNATAYAAGAGTQVRSVAFADTFGSGTGSAGGEALATSIGSGTAGSIQASAEDAIASQYETGNATLTASAIVNTQAKAVASVVQGNTAPALVTNLAAVAAALTAPTTNGPAVSQIFSANATIASAFGAAPTLVGLGELGGGHATNGSDSETSTAIYNADVTLSSLVTPGELVLGLYGGTVLGTGVTGVDLVVQGFGGTLFQLDDVGANAGAEAQAAFTDQVVQLAAWQANTALDLTITLSVTTDAVGSGFFGGFIVGNVPSGGALHSPWLQDFLHDPLMIQEEGRVLF
jgi:hypothetical protein